MQPELYEYALYDHNLSECSVFFHLSVPFKPGGYFSPQCLLEHNANKALANINLLAIIRVNFYRFNKLLSNCLYTQIVREQMEYGLAINWLTSTQIKALEDTQDRFSEPPKSEQVSI